MVDTVKKSMDAIWLTWFLRKVFQVCDGGFGTLTRYFEMVDSTILYPKSWSSEWILGAPHVGFSKDICLIRSRISLLTFGLPGLDLDFQRQYNLNPCRCHLITVSGLTIKRLNFQSVHNWESRDQKRRSLFLSLRRLILRCWTTSCCRRAKFSSRSLLRFVKVTLKIQNISAKLSFNIEFSWKLLNNLVKI